MQPKVSHPSEKEPVKSRISPNVNGPMIAPIIVMKFTKPEAVPITLSGSHSERSAGRIHHIADRKMIGINHAMAWLRLVGIIRENSMQAKPEPKVPMKTVGLFFLRILSAKKPPKGMAMMLVRAVRDAIEPA